MEDKKMKEKKKGNSITKKQIVACIISFLLLFITLFLVVGILTEDKEYAIGEKRIQIPIFLYHHLIEGNIEDVKIDYMETTKNQFEKQVTGFQKLGYHFITYDDLIQYAHGEKKLPQKVALLTFDDGAEDNYTILFPIIKRLNVPVTLNIIDDMVGKPTYLTWNQIREMQESGLVTIACHSKDHQKLNEQDLTTFLANTDIAFQHMEEQIGKQSYQIFTYPCGLYRDDEIEALKEKQVIQNLTDNKINNSKDLDLSKLHRSYPLNDSVGKMLLKIYYRDIRYGGK